MRRATFYRHFKDRNDFYEWYLQTITDQFLSELDEVESAESPDGLEGSEEYMRYVFYCAIEQTFFV